MPSRKHRPRVAILSFVLAIFVVMGPFYFMFYQPQPLNFNTTTKPTWTGIISFWDLPNFDSKKGTNFGWINEKIKQFERKNPGVFIDFNPIASENGSEFIEESIKNGEAPDIVPIGIDTNILTKGNFVPLNEHLPTNELKRFNERIINALTVENEVLALPWMVTTYTMMINMELFRERGVKPPEDGNWTYDEFIATSRQLTYDSRGGDKIDHFGFHSFIEPGYYNMWGILLSDGADIFDENQNYVFTGKEAISGVQKVIDLKHAHGITPESFGEDNAAAAWTRFLKKQDVAVYPVGLWGVNALEQLNNQGEGFEYRTANFPIGNGSTPVIMTSGIGAYAITQQEDPEKLKMCLEFIKFLTDDSHQEELHRLGAFPVKNDIDNIYENQIYMSNIQAQLDNIKIINPHPRWKEIDTIIQEEIKKGILEKKNAEQVVNDAYTEIKQILKN
ncbi:extracellular solute-binding protein [Serpentinicella sp. ANB-PHB4]|uniref:ABC transporter substrate-binding protein n=1 Tax=Serpentinicella sp. ANB-PHB4 TaxID=3074076 RepID=UPI00285AD6BF|nr:extracellular solute-binding protein [Serpentinicella sp. ANB-PHB4]MDR5659373.1 extracellular solute-binding protein [Serpentinicella sp. ANB-PHB4]